MYIIRCLYVDVFSACVWRVVSFLDSQPVVEWGDTRLGTLGTTMSVEWILGPGFFMCPLPCGAGVVLKLVLVCTSDVGWTYCNCNCTFMLARSLGFSARIGARQVLASTVSPACVSTTMSDSGRIKRILDSEKVIAVSAWCGSSTRKTI